MKKDQLKLFVIGLVSCLLFLPQSLAADNQQEQKDFKVSGYVYDEMNEPAIGVTVKINDSSNGTITDYNGFYSLNYSSANDKIHFSYVGYETQVEVLKGRKTLDVKLKPTETQMKEIVVVAYGQQKKVSVTGAISSVSGSDLLKVPTASVGNMLSGVLSGVSSIQYSGQPGADDPEIFVRGIATLNTANATPLILVDGVERSMFNLDPNEIESINVLKDASATAVFGVRGANGVIIVTTKRGTVSNKAQVSASVSYGVQVPTRMVEMVSSYEWASLHNEAMRNDGKPDQQAFSQTALDAFKNKSNPLVYPDVNWTDMLFEKFSPQTQGNVNVSGGTESVRYFTSVGFLNQEGFFKNFDLGYNSNFNYNRYNYRVNLDVNMTKTSLITLNIGGVLEKRNSPNVNQSADQLFRQIYWATPMGGAGIVDGKWVLSNSDIIGSGYIGKDGLSAYYGRGSEENTNNSLNVDLGFEQKMDFVTKGLKFRMKGSYNTGFSLAKHTGVSVNNYTPYYIKDLTWYEPDPSIDPTDPNAVVLVRGGVEGDASYWESTGMSRNWYAETGFDYACSFEDHNLTGLILYSQSKKYYPDKTQYSEIPTGYVGLVGRATYDYQTTYLAEFNIGYNGSENFAKGRRYGVFPAFSLGWVISQEKFMKNLDFINYLKLRASYGVVGNDKAYVNDTQLRFLYLDNPYFSGGGYNFGSGSSRFWTNGYYEGGVGNPYVGWETARKTNIGLDFGIIKEKLVGNIDFFHEKRKDILTEAKTYPAYVTQIPIQNIGEVTNRGMEVMLKWNDKIGDLNYYANLNVSYAKNRIDYMDEVPSKYAHTLQTGHPVGQPFGLKVKGFYYDGMPDVADHSWELREGDVVYEDITGDGFITDEDKVAIGYPNYPLLNGGLTLGVRYKGWDISALIIGATKTSRYLQETFRTPFGEKMDGPVMKTQYENRWTSENRDNATLPIISFDGIRNNYRDSDLWLKDASYMRLKNIQISYTFDIPIFKKLGISQVRPYANAYNLFTIDKLKFIDPESPTSDRPAYPLMLVMNVGVNINF